MTDVTIDDTDQAIVRAVGEELRRARACVGWTRPELIRRMRTQLRLLRRWARNRLVDALTTEVDEPAVVRLPWVVVQEMATLCGMPKRRLLDYIREFTPESALHP